MMKPSHFSALLCVIVFICPNIYAQESPQARQFITDYLASKKEPSRQTTYEFEVIQDYTDPSSGIRSVQALQKLDGIYVLEGILSLHYGHNGRFHAIDQFVAAQPNQKNTSLTAEDAVNIALTHHHMPVPSKLTVKERSSKADHHTVFARNEATAADIIARLMYLNNKNRDGLILTWEVQPHTADRQNYWVT